MLGSVSCRGLIHQAHLFECINKLKGFVYLMQGYDSCRGLIHQAHLLKSMKLFFPTYRVSISGAVA